MADIITRRDVVVEGIPSPKGRGWCEAPGEGYEIENIEENFVVPGPLARATLSRWERDSPQDILLTE
jgi:hypothetical protein